MSLFLDQFVADTDPDMESIRRFWTTDKPLLRNTVAAYAPPYPDYPKRKLNSRNKPSSDPGCPSGRDASDQVEVAMYFISGNGFGDHQEHAWNFITENAPAIEVSLRRKLFAQHLKSFTQFVEEDLPGYKPAQAYWKKIETKLNWSDPSAIDHLYKLVGIGLIDTGLDECGFSSFEFQTGWDHDHGKSILMHKTDVLVAGGMSEYTYDGSNLIDTIKAVQGYDFDDGDLSLRET